MKDSYILIIRSWLDIYIIAIQNHIGHAKSKSKELKSNFHAMKLGSLRLNLIQNAKHLKNRIRLDVSKNATTKFHDDHKILRCYGTIERLTCWEIGDS